ncbi:MAG: carbohydrate ABC transporter substrate-binding protein [Halanaerobiaceae bacterium]|nr:carbohydrate ABC transporter substrate-binding protein [Halanaerobiaceae bacterium]
MKCRYFLSLLLVFLFPVTLWAAEIEVDVFQFKVETKDVLEKAAKMYMEEHPGIIVSIQTVGGGDDYGAALRSRFASGNEPTIFNIGGPQDVEDWIDYLEDLSDQPWVELAYRGVLDGVTVDGKIYGMPFNQEGYGFIYNKTIFEKAGIDAGKINSYDALVEALEILEARKGELGLKAPIAFAPKEKWITGLHLSNVAFSQEFGDVLTAYNAKEVDFTYGEEFKLLVDLQAKYAYKPSGLVSSLNAVDYAAQVEGLFSLEQVALMQQGNWVYNSVASMDEELARNIGILPIPLKGVVEDCIPVGIPMYWTINKNVPEEEKAAAKDFLNWLYTSPAGKELIINEFKFIPAIGGYDGLTPSDPLGQDVLKYSEAGKTMSWVFMGYPSGWGEQVLGANIQAYLAGDISWDELEEICKKEWSEARN